MDIDREELIALVTTMLSDTMEVVPPLNHIATPLLLTILDNLQDGIPVNIPPPPINVRGQEVILHNVDDDWEEYDERGLYLEGIVRLIAGLEPTLHPRAERLFRPLYTYNILLSSGEDLVRYSSIPNIDEDNNNSIYKFNSIVIAPNSYEYPKYKTRDETESDNFIEILKGKRIGADYVKNTLKSKNYLEIIMNDLRLSEQNQSIVLGDEFLQMVIFDTWYNFALVEKDITAEEIEERSNEFFENRDNREFITEMYRTGYSSSYYMGDLMFAYISKYNPNSEYAENIPVVIYDKIDILIMFLLSEMVLIQILDHRFTSPIRNSSYLIRSETTYFSHSFLNILKALFMGEDLSKAMNCYISDDTLYKFYDYDVYIYMSNSYSKRAKFKIPYYFGGDFINTFKTNNQNPTEQNYRSKSFGFTTPFSYDAFNIPPTHEFDSLEMLKNWDPLVLYDNIDHCYYPFRIILDSVSKWNPEVGRPPKFTNGLAKSNGRTSIGIRLTYEFIDLAKSIVRARKKVVQDGIALTDDDMAKINVVANLYPRLQLYDKTKAPHKIQINKNPNERDQSAISDFYIKVFTGGIVGFLFLLGLFCGGFNDKVVSEARQPVNLDAIKCMGKYINDLIEIGKIHKEMETILDLPIVLGYYGLDSLGIGGVPRNGNLGGDSDVPKASIKEMLLDIVELSNDEELTIEELSGTLHEYSEWLISTSKFLISKHKNNLYITALNNFIVYSQNNQSFPKYKPEIIKEYYSSSIKDNFLTFY